MPLRTTDLILSDRQANVDAIIANLDRPDAKDKQFAVALADRCRRAGLDGPTAFAQWLLESNNATSARWNRDLNPTGVGIVASTTQQPFTIQSADDAADLHAQCLYALAHRRLHPGIPLADGIRNWMDRVWLPKVTSTAMPNVRTVHDLGLRYVENGQSRATWSWEDGKVPQDTYGKKLAARYALFDPHAPDQVVVLPAGDIVFGNVPQYGFIDRRHRMANKPAGVGWDNLGKREPWFIALHRIWGYLWNTDTYFANPATQALTDFGVGVRAVDGDAAGTILQWADPLGYRSGWASGRVSAPYGDGKRIVDKYGVIAVNRNGVSVEISGFERTPIDAFSWQEIVHLCAWWVDFMGIPYDTRVNPKTGINYLIWHEEFTLGTGKRCPFDVVKARTNELYDDIAAFLEPYQTGQLGEPQPPVEEPPVEQPLYAEPVPIEALVPFANADADSARAIVSVPEGHDFIFVNDTVRAVRETPRLQRAHRDADHIGPLIEPGLEFPATWLFEANNGGRSEWYYLTPWWTRIAAEDVERVRDAA